MNTDNKGAARNPTATAPTRISVNLPEDTTATLSGRTALITILAIVVAGFGLGVALPTMAPSFTRSLLGDKPKAFWFISRSSAFVAFGLTWISMVLGLLITNRLARIWPGGPTAFDLHQHTSLMALAFAVFHALILLGDKFIGYNLVQLLIPFASTNYEQVWVAFGQISLYVLVIISFSFYVRATITQTGWRLIHFSSFAVFITVVIHSLLSGTDTSATLPVVFYWCACLSVMFLTVWRVIVSVQGTGATLSGKARS